MERFCGSQNRALIFAKTLSAEALRGGGGADSFVQFPLEKSLRKVYNYSTLPTSA
jgi:hypothetical protein